MRGCLANCRPARATSRNRSSIRPRPAMCSRSSAARPSDVQPVLDTVVETAARLCGADSASLAIREGEVYRYVSSSTSAADPEQCAAARQRTIVPGRDSVTARVALEGKVVHVADIRTIPDYAFPGTVASER